MNSSLKILAIIGAGVRRAEGTVDDIIGTQSETRVMRAVTHLLSEGGKTIDVVALCGGIACGTPYQQTPESVLMLEYLLEELAVLGQHLRQDRIVLDHHSLNSAQNVVNLLYLVGEGRSLCTEKRPHGYGHDNRTLSAFLDGNVEAIRNFAAPGAEVIDEITFVTFKAHFKRLVHIVRVGLGIPRSRLKLSFVDTGNPCQAIIDANIRSMNGAKQDPLGVSEEALERLQERLLRAKEAGGTICPITRGQELYNAFLSNLEITSVTEVRSLIQPRFPIVVAPA